MAAVRLRWPSDRILSAFDFDRRRDYYQNVCTALCVSLPLGQKAPSSGGFLSCFTWCLSLPLDGVDWLFSFVFTLQMALLGF